MTIWNLGSINADMVYDLPHLPAPGETLAALGLDRFLGGKGANMSVAAARAGARVSHIRVTFQKQMYLPGTQLLPWILRAKT